MRRHLRQHVSCTMLNRSALRCRHRCAMPVFLEPTLSIYLSHNLLCLFPPHQTHLFDHYPPPAARLPSSGNKVSNSLSSPSASYWNRNPQQWQKQLWGLSPPDAICVLYDDAGWLSGVVSRVENKSIYITWPCDEPTCPSHSAAGICTHGEDDGDGREVTRFMKTKLVKDLQKGEIRVRDSLSET